MHERGDGIGPVVLLSGADGGIGTVVAKDLMSHGYRVSMGAMDIQTLVKIHGPEKVEAIYAEFNAFKYESAQNWVSKTIDRYGRIDALVNCVGWAERVTLYDENEEGLDRLWEVNAKAPLRLTRLCLPYLEKTGAGRVVNLASLAGKRVRNAAVGYAMSKYALMAVTHATRTLTWDKGIRATAICPGWVRTEMSKNVKNKSIEPGEMITPETIALLVRTAIELPNSAAIAEFLVNCEFEDMF